MDFISLLLPQLVFQIPAYLAWITGMILAAVYWRKHPWVSLTALIGLGIFFLESVVGLGQGVLLQYRPFSEGMSFQQIGIIYTAIGIIRTAAVTAAWILILVAIFGWRNASRPEPAAEAPLR